MLTVGHDGTPVGPYDWESDDEMSRPDDGRIMIALTVFVVAVLLLVLFVQ